MNKFPKKLLKMLPGATSDGIVEMMRLFQKMERSAYSDPQFVKQIDKSIGAFKTILEENSISTLLEQKDSIEGAIAFIITAISNRLEGSRYIYETKNFNPENIGPFSRLYVYYENFVDFFEELTEVYNDILTTGANSARLNFLLDISTHASISAESFVPDSDSKNPSQRLIGLTINEFSFFQIPQTILLLLHEIGHYIRPYSIQKRNQLYVDLLINWISQSMTGIALSTIVKPIKTKKKDPVEEKIRKHYEKEVLPFLQVLLTASLNIYFSTHLSGKENMFRYILQDFHLELDKSLKSLIREINETDSGNSRFWGGNFSTIFAELLDSEPLKSGEDIFDFLCDLATDLITGDPELLTFQATSGQINDDPLNRYLGTISQMGLNENTPANKRFFVTQFVKIVKKALDVAVEISVIDSLKVTLDETVADHFVLRTLGIKNYEEFKSSLYELYFNDNYSKHTLVDFFGFRHAVIERYFDKKNGLTVIDQDEIPLEPGGGEKTKSLLWNIWVEPIAEYLSKDSNVFPEREFFQQKRTLNDFGLKVRQLRKQFRKLSKADVNSVTFDDELLMLELLGSDE